MTRTAYRLLGVALAALLLLSCDRMRQLKTTLGEILVVQAKVAQKLNQQGVHAENVSVNLGSGTLTVILVNSPLKAEGFEKKQMVAREIADVAFQAFPSRSSLSNVQVSFMVSRTYFGMFTFTDTRDSIVFPVMKLREGAKSSAGLDRRKRPPNGSMS